MGDVDRMLMQLNNATREWHDVADEPWMELLRSDVGLRDYLDQLVRMHGFVAPLEGALAYTPELPRLLDLRRLRRAGLIAQDLLALGVSPTDLSRLPQCFSITPFKDIPEALGWLYVVERSTLLHDRVRRHVLNRVPDAKRACAYLSMFDNAGDSWRRFGKTVDRVASRAEVETEIIDAAHAGFSALQGWFRSFARRSHVA
jgi:heme oxygenase